MLRSPSQRWLLPRIVSLRSIGLVQIAIVGRGSLVVNALLVQEFGYGNKLDLSFDGRPLNYPLFINNFQQRERMINDPAVELNLLIQ